MTNNTQPPLTAATKEDSLKRACNIVDQMIIDAKELRLQLEKEGHNDDA